MKTSVQITLIVNDGDAKLINTFFSPIYADDL